MPGLNLRSEQFINLDIVRLEQRRKDDDAGVRRLPEFLITLVARPTVRNIAGSGTAEGQSGSLQERE